MTVADSSNNLEIEERSIKNIAQKVQLSLLTPTELAVNHGQQIGYLLTWVNKRYTHATNACLLSTYQIFAQVASCEVRKPLTDLLNIRKDAKF
jgi:hypothetical protein